MKKTLIIFVISTINNFYIELNPIKEYYFAKTSSYDFSLINKTYACWK